MKRRLLLIRHAKAGKKGPGIDDHGRELTERGRADALRIAAKIGERSWVPERALISDSTRTVETWGLMDEVFEEHIETEELEKLYLGDVDDICEAIYELDDDIATAALVGHNPGWQKAVEWFSGSSVRMKTCNAALLRAEGDSWAEAAQRGQWTLFDVLRPDEF